MYRTSTHLLGVDGAGKAERRVMIGKASRFRAHHMQSHASSDTIRFSSVSTMGRLTPLPGLATMYQLQFPCCLLRIDPTRSSFVWNINRGPATRTS